MQTRLRILSNYQDSEAGEGSPLFCIDTPEKQLFAAVLIRAIHDYVSTSKEPLGRYNYRSQTFDLVPSYLWLFDSESTHEGSLMWVLSYITNCPERAYKLLEASLTCEIKKAQVKEAISSKKTLRVGRNHKPANRLVRAVEPAIKRQEPTQGSHPVSYRRRKRARRQAA